MPILDSLLKQAVEEERERIKGDFKELILKLPKMEGDYSAEMLKLIELLATKGE
jgi:hypothetical protein